MSEGKFENWVLPSDHLICMYEAEAITGTPLQKAAREIASYSSLGLYNYGARAEKYKAEILSCEELEGGVGIILIAYPPEAFDLETGGISGILSIISGWSMSLSRLSKIRIRDILFPESITSKFIGPKMGQSEINGLLGVKKRECYLTVPIYPRLGINMDEYKKILEMLLKQAPSYGPDMISDSELLFNPPECRVSERVTAMKDEVNRLAKMKDLEDNTEKFGGKTLFFVNVTGIPSLATAHASLVKDAGLHGIAVNVLPAGFSLLEQLRKEFPHLIVYAHANMHSVFTRGQQTGMSYGVLLKLFRLAGADIIYTGTPYGALDLFGDLEKHVLSVQNHNEILRSQMHKLKPAIPSILGGITLGNLEVNLKLSGLPLQMVVGGGIYDYTGPSPQSKIEIAGAKAKMRLGLGQVPRSYDQTDPAYAIKLFKKAIYSVTILNESMWRDHELKDNKDNNPVYFNEHFVNAEYPQDPELSRIMQRYSKLELKGQD